jgi:hypothetical protein
MVRFASAVAIVCILLLAGLRVSGPRAAVVACGSRSIGPGELTHDSGRGARCLLAAYRNHCRQARYQLSIFGIDTVAIDTFRVVTHDGRCQVALASSFRVVPQPAHPTGSGFCGTLRWVGNSIVASGCKGSGLPQSISLTGIS